MKAAARLGCGRQPLMPGLAERTFIAAAAGGGAAFARAVQRGDGLDVRPHEVVADEGAGHVAASSLMRARVTLRPLRVDSGTKRTRVPVIWLAFTSFSVSTP